MKSPYKIREMVRLVRMEVIFSCGLLLEDLTPIFNHNGLILSDLSSFESYKSSDFQKMDERILMCLFIFSQNISPFVYLSNKT